MEPCQRQKELTGAGQDLVIDGGSEVRRHARLCSCTDTHTHSRMHIDTHTYMHPYNTHINIHIQIHVHIYIHIHTPLVSLEEHSGFRDSGTRGFPDLVS